MFRDKSILGEIQRRESKCKEKGHHYHPENPFMYANLKDFKDSNQFDPNLQHCTKDIISHLQDKYKTYYKNIYSYDECIEKNGHYDEDSGICFTRLVDKECKERENNCDANSFKCKSVLTRSGKKQCVSKRAWESNVDNKNDRKDKSHPLKDPSLFQSNTDDEITSKLHAWYIDNNLLIENDKMDKFLGIVGSKCSPSSSQNKKYKPTFEELLSFPYPFSTAHRHLLEKAYGKKGLEDLEKAYSSKAHPDRMKVLQERRPYADEEDEWMELDTETESMPNNKYPTLPQSVINAILSNIKLERRGILGWHSTGSGKTATATGVMDAFWNSGRQIVFASSIDAVAANPDFKFHEYAKQLYPRFANMTLNEISEGFKEKGIIFISFAKLANRIAKGEELKQILQIQKTGGKPSKPLDQYKGPNPEILEKKKRSRRHKQKQVQKELSPKVVQKPKPADVKVEKKKDSGPSSKVVSKSKPAEVKVQKKTDSGPSPKVVQKPKPADVQVQKKTDSGSSSKVVQKPKPANVKVQIKDSGSKNKSPEQKQSFASIIANKYGKDIEKVKKALDKAKIKNSSDFVDLDNTILIIDEVHNLFRPLATQKEKHKYVEDHLVNPKKHPNLKIVILTATPGDNVSDVLTLLNMINDPKKPRIVAPDPTNAQSIKMFKESIKGMVSYYDMSNDTSLFPVLKDNGPMKYPMSMIQFEKYAAAYNDVKDSMKDYDALAKNNTLNKFWQGARKYSNMLYTFDKSLQLSEMSSKLPALLKNIEKFPNQKHYVYSAFFEKRGSSQGILEIARQLDKMGYTKLSIEDAKKELKPKKRYVLAIQSEISVDDKDTGKNLDYLVQAFNNKNNVDGKNIHIFLASQSFNEGLDLKAVRHIHIFEPLVTIASDIQTIGRARRYCSHADLDHKEWTVEIHRYLSDLPKSDGIIKEEKSKKKKSNAEVVAIDEFVQKEAMKRMRDLFTIYISMKEAAIDCKALYKFHTKDQINPEFTCNDQDIHQ